MCIVVCLLVTSCLLLYICKHRHKYKGNIVKPGSGSSHLCTSRPSKRVWISWLLQYKHYLLSLCTHQLIWTLFEARPVVIYPLTHIHIYVLKRLYCSLNVLMKKKDHLKIYFLLHFTTVRFMKPTEIRFINALDFGKVLWNGRYLYFRKYHFHLSNFEKRFKTRFPF